MGTAGRVGDVFKDVPTGPVFPAIRFDEAGLERELADGKIGEFPQDAVLRPARDGAGWDRLLSGLYAAGAPG